MRFKRFWKPYNSRSEYLVNNKILYCFCLKHSRLFLMLKGTVVRQSLNYHLKLYFWTLSYLMYRVSQKKRSLVRRASISLRNIFSGTPGLFEFLTLIFTLSDYFSILSLSNFILWFKIFFSGKLCSWGSNNSVPRTNHFISEEVVLVHLQCQIFWQNVPA